MKVFGVVLVALLSVIVQDVRADAATGVKNANLFIDSVLNNYMPSEGKIAQLDPISLGVINIRVTEGNMLQHKFKANFSFTEVKGLSSGVHRFGNCSAPGMIGNNVVVGCNVHFGDVKIKLQGKGHGDGVLNTEHNIAAKVTFGNSYALVEAWGPNSLRPGVLKTFKVMKMTFNIKTEKIDLTGKRAAQFQSLLENELLKTFSNLLTTKYELALDKAVKQVNLPPIS